MPNEVKITKHMPP